MTGKLEKLLRTYGARITRLERRQAVSRSSALPDFEDHSDLLAGVSGYLGIRRVGPSVQIIGSTDLDIAAGTSVTDILSAPIPAKFRPSTPAGGTGNRWGSAYCAGYSASALVRTTGTIAISNRNPADFSASIQFSINYMI